MSNNEIDYKKRNIISNENSKLPPPGNTNHNNHNTDESTERYPHLTRFISEIESNIIKVKYKSKKSKGDWKEAQSKIISYDHFEKSKKSKELSNWGIITGRILRGQYKDKYLVCVDLDNKKAIEVFLNYFFTRPDATIDELAKLTIVVQHDDVKNEKAHVYFITEKQLTKINRIIPLSNISCIPQFEVKSDSTTYMVSPDSIHPDGEKYRIVGTFKPVVLNSDESESLEKILEKMYQQCLEWADKNGLSKDKYVNKIPSFLKNIAKSLNIENNLTTTSIIKKGTRNNTLFGFALCMLGYHYRSNDEEHLKSFMHKVNQKLSEDPLPDSEVDDIWNSAFEFIEKKNSKNRNLKKDTSAYKNDTDRSKDCKPDTEDENQNQKEVIELATEKILNSYHFITLEETKQIYYYKNGVYVPNGEILIEKEIEGYYSYKISNKHVAEIKGHIMRKTFHKKTELDQDIHIINMKNGLYDISKNELKPHAPDYLSIIQHPVNFDPKARPKLYIKFLKDVLYKEEIRSAIDMMAYTFYRDCPFEYYFILLGKGSNGKSIVTSILTALVGLESVSNVPLKDLLENRFALSDLENKNINIDNDVTNANIGDTSILKKGTGGKRQPIRIERKNKQAYDTFLFAKIILNANELPNIKEKTPADYRREIIISFPNTFEGENKDPNLKDKLIHPEELSGIFNLLMHNLRLIIKNKDLHLYKKTIEERRIKSERETDSVGSFLEEAIAEDSSELDHISKQDAFNAYEGYCQKWRIIPKTIEMFGKDMKKKNYKETRKTINGKRITAWIGIKIKPEYPLMNRPPLLLPLQSKIQ